MSISILMDGWLLSILVSPSEHGDSSLWREKHLEVRGVIRAAWAARSLSEPKRTVLSDRKKVLSPAILS